MLRGSMPWLRLTLRIGCLQLFRDNLGALYFRWGRGPFRRLG